MDKLYLERDQETAELADALRRLYPVLAVAGVVKVDILEHTCGEHGSWHLEMASPTAATLYRNRFPDRSGPLAAVLGHLAQHHWG